jgi:predicted transcriptional regulator YheO
MFIGVIMWMDLGSHLSSRQLGQSIDQELDLITDSSTRTSEPISTLHKLDFHSGKRIRS